MSSVRYPMLIAVVAALVYFALRPMSWHRPPVTTKEPITFTIFVDKLAELQAKEAVQLAHDNYDIDLDYTDRSIADVEHILDSLQHRWFFKHDEKWASWFGSYVGEVLRRNHRVGWIVQKNSDGKTRAEILLSRSESTDPIDQCRKRLKSGAAYNVAAYYGSVVKSLDDRK